MLDKCEKLAKRLAEVESRMLQPEVYADPAAYAALAREQKELTPLVAAYWRYRDFEAAERDALLLMEDAEMRELAREEYDAAREGIEKTRQEL